MGGKYLRGTHTFQTNHTYQAGDVIDVTFKVDSGQYVPVTVGPATTQSVSGIDNYTYGTFLGY